MGSSWLMWLDYFVAEVLYAHDTVGIASYIGILCQCWRFSCMSWAPLMGDSDDIITERGSLRVSTPTWVTINGIAEGAQSRVAIFFFGSVVN